MSATDRRARHLAVCGEKPGGADAYYLKETCAPKNGPRYARDPQEPARTRDMREGGHRVLEMQAIFFKARADAMRRALRNVQNARTRPATSGPNSESVVRRVVEIAIEHGGVQTGAKRPTDTYRDAVESYNANRRPRQRRAVMEDPTMLVEFFGEMCEFYKRSAAMTRRTLHAAAHGGE